MWQLKFFNCLCGSSYSSIGQGWSNSEGLASYAPQAKSSPPAIYFKVQNPRMAFTFPNGHISTCVNSSVLPVGLQAYKPKIFTTWSFKKKVANPSSKLEKQSDVYSNDTRSREVWDLCAWERFLHVWFFYWDNIHISIKLTTFKWRNQWHLVHSQCSATSIPTYLILKHLVTQNRTPIPLAGTPPPLTRTLATTDLLSVSLGSPVPEISYKQDHAVCDLFVCVWLLHVTSWFWGSVMSQPVPVFHSFLYLNISFCEHTTICLSIHPVMNVRVVATF